MKTVKLSTETKSWMRYLTPAAKSMLFALPFLMGQNLAFAEETNARDEIEQEAKETKRKID